MSPRWGSIICGLSFFYDHVTPSGLGCYREQLPYLLCLKHYDGVRRSDTAENTGSGWSDGHHDSAPQAGRGWLSW